MENTNNLKGYFALCVLAHHLYQYSGISRGTIAGMCFQMMGYLSVAVFFFFTGYGLMVSANKPNYIAQFPRKRILPFYLFYVVLVFVYGAYSLLLSEQLSFQHIVRSFLWGGTIVPLGWYLQTTLIIYALYWVIWRIMKSTLHQLITFGGILCVYCVMCIVMGMSSTWYESIFAVYAGMLWAKKKKSIDTYLSDRPVCWVAITAVILAVSVLLQKVNCVAIGAKMISALAFVCLVMTIAYCLANSRLINNAAAKWLGTFSLGIYVSQGFFLVIKTEIYSFYSSSMFFILVSTIGTFIVSVLMQKVNKLIYRTINK